MEHNLFNKSEWRKEKDYNFGEAMACLMFTGILVVLLALLIVT